MESNFDIIETGVLAKSLADLIKKEVTKKTPGKKRIYFAGPWFTDKGRFLHAACKKMYQLLKNQSSYDVFFPNDFHDENPKNCFDMDVNEVKECDILVALIDEKDVGTAWEIGMAYALNKPIYLLGFDETSFMRRTNLMLAFTGKCFTFSKWSKFLTSGLGYDEFVNTEKTWEVLE